MTLAPQPVGYEPVLHGRRHTARGTDALMVLDVLQMPVGLVPNTLDHRRVVIVQLVDHGQVDRDLGMRGEGGGWGGS